jgi:hypothetical protein
LRHLALLLAASALLGISTVHAETAAEMASACPRFQGDHLIEFPHTTFDTGRCWGAFAIIQEVARFTDRQGSSSRFLLACSPLKAQGTNSWRFSRSTPIEIRSACT